MLKKTNLNSNKGQNRKNSLTKRFRVVRYSKTCKKKGAMIRQYFIRGFLGTMYFLTDLVRGKRPTGFQFNLIGFLLEFS